jgi:glycosyltransferase involved in cell wall biosynthesis
MKVKEFTKAALADAIAYLLQNPAKAEEMTKNALMFVRRFDWAQITTDYEHLISTITDLRSLQHDKVTTIAKI